MTTETTWAGPASALFRSLSNEHRLLALQHLRDGEKSMVDLTRLIGTSQPRLVVQMQRLIRDHLVTTRREGRVIIYSLARDDVFMVLNAAREMFEGRE
jgi:DNA-binding transcriptional ArsR family regulator